ncbi:MAG: hypothetical protein ABI948_09210 [Thermoleophilia bacterium]
MSRGPIYPKTCRRSAWRRDGASLFVRGDRHGGSQIWIHSAKGREWKLTNDLPRDPIARVANHTPAWSPDGSRVAFLSARSSGSDVYVIDADGTHERRLTWNANGFGVSWSADGSTIAFLNGYPQTLFVVPAVGGTPRQVLAKQEEVQIVDCQPSSLTPQLAPLRPFRRRARRLNVLPGYLPRRQRPPRARAAVRLPGRAYSRRPVAGRTVRLLSRRGRVARHVRPPPRRAAYADESAAGTRSYEQVGGGYFSSDRRWILVRVRNELRLVSR